MSTKQEKGILLKEMRNLINERKTNGLAVFTCNLLRDLRGEHSRVLREYKLWLLDSFYYVGFDENLDTVYVSHHCYAYTAKFKMFKEFLDQYKGEI